MTLSAESAVATSAARRPRWLVVRLAVQMFLAYAIQGAWVPVFAIYLKQIGFSPAGTAWAFASYSISSLVAPLAWGQVADRWVPAERCLFICGLGTAATLLALPRLESGVAVFAVCVLFWFFMIPGNSLGAALTLRQLQHPERHYGAVRLWGTIGWALAGVILSGWLTLRANVTGSATLADSFHVGAAFALALAVYSLTLPATPPVGLAATPTLGLRRFIDAPLRSLALLRRPVFLIYSACLFGAYLTMPFGQQLIPLVLQQHGIDDEVLPVALTLAQSSEVVLLALLPWLLGRGGVKATMALGLGAWAAELAVYAVGQPRALLLAALPIQGLFITCYLVAGQVFVNRLSAADVRASAQGLIVLIIGVGLLIGNLVVGGVRALTADRYELAFLPALAVAVGLVVLFALGFRTVPAPPLPDSLVPGQEIS